MAAAQGVGKLAQGVGTLARGAGRLKGTVIDKYYDPDTHTFDISGHVLGVTLKDVLYLTGLPIQGKPLIYEKSLDEDAFMRVFGEEFKDRKTLTFDEVKNIARDGRRLFNVRKIAVLLIMCEYFICPTNNHHTVISQKVHLVENVDEIDSYALGAALLSFLYHGLKYKKRKKKHIDGNLWIVLGFLLVRIPKIQDMLGINFKNYPPDVIEGAPLLPWIVGEIKRKTRNHWATHDMPAIASFSDEDIIWTPYKQMACPRPGDLKSVRNLVPLIGYNCVHHHMPHNCSDQFPVLQDYNFRSLTWKPCEIPPFKKLGGGHNIDYKDLYEEQIAEWNAGKPAEAYMTLLQQKHNLYDDELVLRTKFIKASEDTSDIRRSRSITKLSITQLSLCKWKLFLANKKLRQDDIFGIENVNAGGSSMRRPSPSPLPLNAANDGGGENDPRSGRNEERSSMHRPSPSPPPLNAANDGVGENDPRSGRNEERSSMRRPSPSPPPVTLSDADRANDNSFEIENDNSQLGDRANDGGGENDADRANDNSFEIENDNSQLGDRVDDGGSEKGKQEDPGSDPRMPIGRQIYWRKSKGQRLTSYYGLTTVRY
ncbi:hypothetical protein DCAR_0311814 [Daucus carota subsp. sativus]|uniref:Aminotransferase-like plant mobile domain-containing protein n=1 Tax=Daucus carota subsp. sativus TaxID=79200 RepID=A0AAF0WNR2_DAUCS|nr:hypothetical protein DCAR_0311814 [Daucus carota subsp. sativus]